MGIYRSTNPTDWNQVDGIIIDEISPAPSINGVPANTAILVGQFERGSVVLDTVGSLGQLYEKYGNNISYSGSVALTNKRWGALKVIRVAASDSAIATNTFVNGTVNIISFSALWKGVYGNSITVTVAAGSTSGSKYTIHDGNANAVFPDEVYDNVVITAIAASNPFANSNLISATVIASSAEPSTASATALSSGSDGSVVDADYQAAILAQQTEAAGNILFLDTYNTTRNGYLKTSMAATQDRMTVMCGAAGDSVATAVTAAASQRDSDGRIIYTFPYLYTTVNGVNTKVNPCSFYASLLSQIGPNIDPAYAGNVQYLSGINSLELSLQRSDYISLMAAGISAFEVDNDLGIKIKSGVVTQIANTGKLMVTRRRMTDYITYSVAKFLKAYQNAPNTADNRTAVAAAIANFDRGMELDGLVPKDSEVQGGLAKLIDVKSLNTNTSIGLGYFKLLYKRRIYNSMRFIVVEAQIGETVVVTAQESA